MAGKRRSRLNKRRDPYGSDSNDSDYEPWAQEKKRKARKTHSPARSRRAPSLVTPEQIIANAAAARLAGIENDQQQRLQRQDERSTSSHKRTSTHNTLAPVATSVAYDTKANVKAELQPTAQVRTELKREVKVKPELKAEAPPVAFAPTLARKDSDELAVVDLQSSDELDDDNASDEDDDEDEDDRVLEATTDAGHDDVDEDYADDDDAPMPAVFQCGTCRSIIGDTYALVGSRKTSLMLSLSAVANITVSPALQTARSGVHAGSSYHKLLCSECEAVLGRQYVATPVALDELRGLFCFRTTAITSYQLGVEQLQHHVAADDSAGDGDDDISSSVQVNRVGM